ncbi:MAG: thioredoxin family protein [Methanobacteriales archaeon HGW-Methanobacteriales-1]|jgi:thiol:disulfide interchange protein DsbD|nr:MAG: thioredoxin family protein [Methanobacteriales archaeon HGW-Methanobacteriales-1]
MSISLKSWIIAALLISLIIGVTMVLTVPQINNSLSADNKASNQSYELKWYTNLDATISEAQKTNKPIFAVFSASWCPACQQLESETLVDNEVKQKLAQNYVAVKIDLDTNPELSSKYGIYGIPAIIFMNSNGEETKRIEGYVSHEQLLSAL